MGQIPFTPFEQMNNQMQELAIQKAPQPPQVTSKWGPAQTKITQPTMSQIVAQNVQNIQPSNVIEKQNKSALKPPLRKKIDILKLLITFVVPMEFRLKFLINHLNLALRLQNKLLSLSKAGT